MLGKSLILLLTSVAAACGGRAIPRSLPDGGLPDGGLADGQAATERQPRWIALGNKFDLSVVRFDDPASPVTTLLAWVDLPNRTPPTTLPALVLPAQFVEDAEVMSVHTSWSMDGHHLVFGTRQAEGIKLWVASAADSFVPREIAFGAATQVIPRWIGDETMVIAVVHGEQVDFVRVNAPDWSVERLGSYVGSDKVGAATNATFNASRSGALYSLGSPDAGELWLARGKEPPRRIGSALPQGGGPCQYKLTWSLDSQSAVWWGRAVFDDSLRNDLVCQSPPPVDLVPGAIPSIGIEAQSTRFQRYSTPKVGDQYVPDRYDWSAISWAVSGSPVGPGIAYGICPASSSTSQTSVDRPYLGTLVVKSAVAGDPSPAPRQESGVVVCEARHPAKLPRFGFINTTDYFFTRWRSLVEGEAASYEFVIHRQGQDQIVLDRLTGVVEAGVFARGNHLFVAAVDANGLGLWSVDLTVPNLTAERVALEVAPKEWLASEFPLRPSGFIPSLRSSEWLGGVDHDDEPIWDSPSRESLLVQIQPANCSRCSRWSVVNFDDQHAVVPLDPAWREWDLTWTPDAEGLLAVGQGVYWLTGSGYRDRYRLSADNAVLFIPPRWPVR